MRVFVVVATAVYAGFNAILQLFVAGNGSPSIVATANAVILAGVVIAIAYSLMRINGETLFPAAEKPAAAAVASTRDEHRRPKAARCLDAADGR